MSKLNKCTRVVITLVIGVLLIFLAYKLNEDNIKTASIVGRLNAVAKDLSKDKYKDYEGAELYEDGIVEGVESYYTVYELDNKAISTYNKNKGLETILKGIKPIIEAPLLSKSNEILSVLQIRGNKVVEKPISMPVDVLNYMINGNLDRKIKVLSNDIGDIESINYLRLIGYDVDVMYIGSLGGEYILPLLSDDVAKKMEVVNYRCYTVDEFMEKLLLLEK